MTAGRLFPVQQEQLTSDDYYTPRWVFDRMGLVFDLDVCAPPGGVEWVPAVRYFDQAADGLAQPWEGRVWMNPPFSNPTPWVAKFIEHRRGVCLVPTSNGRWMDRLWGVADAVGLAGPNMEFANGIGYGSLRRIHFAAFGDECVEAIGRLGVVRKIA